MNWDDLSFVEISVLNNYEALRFRSVLALLILTLATCDPRNRVAHPLYPPCSQRPISGIPSSDDSGVPKRRLSNTVTKSNIRKLSSVGLLFHRRGY